MRAVTITTDAVTATRLLAALASVAGVQYGDGRVVERGKWGWERRKVRMRDELGR